MAAKTTRSRTRKSKVPMTEDGNHPMYDASVGKDSYKPGDIVFFPKVRNWLNRGEVVEAFGKVIKAEVFENEVPYIEVSFHEVKKMNNVDLGKDLRRFMLEVD